MSSSFVSPLQSATRIVATLGPASGSEKTLNAMLKAGVDVFRFNMSHGDHADHAEMMARVRRVSEKVGRPTGILVDLQGPKVRTQKNVFGEPIMLSRGETITISTGKSRSEPGHVVVDFAGIINDLKAGDRMLFDDGKLIVDVKKSRSHTLSGLVVQGGPLKERAGVNVPGRALKVVIPTAKDRRDVAFALEQDADFIALSFVQSAADILRLKRLIARTLKDTDRRPPAIIAKIEKPLALEDLDNILNEVEGVMVARGDLGVELSLEKVPTWQKKILGRARARGVFSITATQMLESMITNPTPTRAEVSDVANAIFDGTDSVMLSAETAVGEYPAESVRMLTKISSEVEPDFFKYGPGALEPGAFSQSDRPVEAVVRAGVEMAERSRAKWIVILTLHGRTVGLTTRYHPKVGVVAITPHESTRRRLTVRWNTRSLLLESVKSTEELMRRAVDELRTNRLVKNGDTIVMMAGDAGMEEASNLLRLVKIEPKSKSKKKPAT